MLLSQVEAFLAVAERRSVSAAAAALYVTQPALTTRIKNLERELGVDLFSRRPHGMRLTAEGRAFRPHAQRALQALAEGREVLRERREGTVGELLDSWMETPTWWRRDAIGGASDELVATREVWRVEAVRAGRSRMSFAGVYDLAWDSMVNRWDLVRVHD